MNRSVWVLVLLMFALAACGTQEPTVVGIGDMLPSGSGPVLPTATPPVTVTPVDTPLPAEPSFNFTTYQHTSGVFSISLPESWETFDESTEQQLLIRLLPPAGYASRIVVDITNEGPLSPEQVQDRLTSYVQLHYAQNPAYIEINRSVLPDGRSQVNFAYTDNKGASGQEIVYIQQSGPYFAALRIFLSDKDTAQLHTAFETLASSFSVNALAVWGSQVAAINPAELLLVNTSLWRDESGQTYYMGEVYNTSPTEIAGIEIDIAFCNNDGVVLAEFTQPPSLDEIESGGTGPFAIVAKGLTQAITICVEQVSAVPSRTDSPHTTALQVTTSTSSDKDELTVQGQVTNPGLATVNDLEVLLVIYDDAGQVIGHVVLGFGSDGWLEPGQTRYFGYTFPALGGDPARIRAIGQGKNFVPTDPSIVPTPTP